MTDNFGNNIVVHCNDYTKLHCHQFQHTIHTNIEPRLYTFKSESYNMTLNTRKHQMEEKESDVQWRIHRVTCLT